MAGGARVGCGPHMSAVAPATAQTHPDDTGGPTAPKGRKPAGVDTDACKQTAAAKAASFRICLRRCPWLLHGELSSQQHSDVLNHIHYR